MTEPVILLIDAFPSTRRIIANLLHQIGLAEIEEVDDLQAMRGVVEKKTVVMVMCNPHKEASCLLTPQIVANEAGDIPVLWVVNDDQMDSLEEGSRFSRITKPFGVEDLRDKVETILGI